MKRNVYLAFSMLLAATALACGGGSNNNTNPDANTGSTADAGPPLSNACTGVNTTCDLGGDIGGVCVAGACSTCSNDNQCAVGSACSGAVCAEAACSSGSSCPSGFCFDGACGLCASDLDCPLNQACNANTGVCFSNAIDAVCTFTSGLDSCPGSATANDICCGSSSDIPKTDVCTAGQCCLANDCPGNETCIHNVCVSNDGGCTAPTGLALYVSPSSGTDIGSGSAACPFKTLKEAFVYIRTARLNPAGADNSAATVTLMDNDDTVNEGFPITIPGNTTLKGATNTVTVTMPSQSITAFNYIDSSSSAINSLTITGAPFQGIGVDVNGAGTLTLHDVTISGFKTGIVVDSGVAAISGPAMITGNFTGMHIHGGAAASIDAATMPETVHFDTNNYGIINEAGALQIHGAAPTVTPTVTFQSNAFAAIITDAPQASLHSLTNEILHGFFYNNGTVDTHVHGAVVVLAGSHLKVRSSFFQGNNAPAVAILPNGGSQAAGTIDLGNMAASDPGLNNFDRPVAEPAICVDSGQYATNEILAEGNTFGTVDCTTATTPLITFADATNCQGSGDVVFATAGSVVSVSGCTLP